MSLKLVPFERSGIVSYSHSIVSMAVSLAISEISNVSERRYLENWDMGRSKSLKMSPFDRPYLSFYRSAIITIALSCTVFELFDIG